ncbi:MAG TPA: adenylosuccinate lyase [Acidimicrobiia bacterium]|jgi:adenylosuccinate lyase
MIPRYTRPEMAALFTDEAKLGAWLEVEVLACEGWAEIGVVPEEHARAIRERGAFTVDAVLEREKVTDHDVAAFVDVVQESVGMPAGAWVHYGLTSTDVVDTAQNHILVQALDVLASAAERLEKALVQVARAHRDTACVGRTHGIHAEPTTFGTKPALWALQVRRDRQRIARARTMMAVGKLSGAVGTYSNIDPSVEQYVCEHLGLQPVPATQVVARDRHAEMMYVTAAIGTTCETIGLEVRHLQRTEVREVLEPFRMGAQKGSSAMPHKRNPIKSEQLCGLARVLRGNVVPALENVALWHERDISHSSAERVIFADSLQLAHYVLVQATTIVSGLQVDAARMRENLDASYGLVFSQPVLLALVEAGTSRDDAYRIVQRAAMTSWDTRRMFRDVLGDDPEVTKHLTHERLDECFDLVRSLGHVGRTFDAIDEMERTPLQ